MVARKPARDDGGERLRRRLRRVAHTVACTCGACSLSSVSSGHIGWCHPSIPPPPASMTVAVAMTDEPVEDDIGLSDLSRPPQSLPATLPPPLRLSPGLGPNTTSPLTSPSSPTLPLNPPSPDLARRRVSRSKTLPRAPRPMHRTRLSLDGLAMGSEKVAKLRRWILGLATGNYPSTIFVCKCINPIYSELRPRGRPEDHECIPYAESVAHRGPEYVSRCRAGLDVQTFKLPTEPSPPSRTPLISTRGRKHTPSEYDCEILRKEKSGTVTHLDRPLSTDSSTDFLVSHGQRTLLRSEDTNKSAYLSVDGVQCH